MNNRLKTTQSPCFDIESSCCKQTMACDPLQTMPLAMAYVPWQQWKNIYEGGKGLEHGTIFEELIFPFQFASCVCGNSAMKQSCHTACNNAWNSRNSMYMNYNMERTCCNDNCNYNNNCNTNLTNNSNTNCNSDCINNSSNNCNNSSLNSNSNSCDNGSMNSCNKNCNSALVNNTSNTCSNRCMNHCNNNCNTRCNTKKTSNCGRRCD